MWVGTDRIYRMNVCDSWKLRYAEDGATGMLTNVADSVGSQEKCCHRQHPRQHPWLCSPIGSSSGLLDLVIPSRFSHLILLILVNSETRSSRGLRHAEKQIVNFPRNWYGLQLCSIFKKWKVWQKTILIGHNSSQKLGVLTLSVWWAKSGMLMTE